MTSERVSKRGEKGGGQSGTALVMALFLITVLTVLGTMVLNTSIVEIKMAGNQKISSQVFYAAEAGLERGLLMLIRDFEEDTTAGAPWANSVYAGWSETVTESGHTGTVPFDPAVRTMDMYLTANDPNLKKLTLSGGHTVYNCTFELYIYKHAPNEVWIMSYASGNTGVAAVEYHLAGEDASPYNNALFTGSGISGSFQGSVNIAGSIYSRGTLTIGQNIHVNNNYDDVRVGLTWADNPTLNSILNYEDDLDTKVRVKGGDLTIESASSQVGMAGTNGAVRGVYVDGTSNIESVGTHYYEEYQSEVPDVEMPTILDGLYDELGEAFVDQCITDEGYTGDISAIATSLYADWATGTGCFTDTRGVVVDEATATAEGLDWDNGLVIDKNTPSFSIIDALGNGITYTAPATPPAATADLTIQGTVVIDGDLTIGDNMITRIDYTATGVDTGSGSDAAEGATLFVDGSLTYTVPFYPEDGYLMGDSYPGTNDINSLGIVATQDINFSGHNEDVHAGFHYAQGQANFNLQTKLAGTVIAGLINYAQVPDIYQVPNLKNHLPPAIPGGGTVIKVTQREWRRVY